MANLDFHPYGEGFNRNEPIMVGSSDDEEDNIEHRRTRRLGGPQGTPRPRRGDRNLRIFSPAPAPPALGLHFLQAIPLLGEVSQEELMRMLIEDQLNRPPRGHLPPIVRTRQPVLPQEPEPYDVRMTHASARPRLGFTFDFEQPEEEEKVVVQKARVRVPVKYKQTIEIPDSPPLQANDKGKGKAKVEEIEDELVLDRHKEIIEIYSDDEEGADSVASSSQQPVLVPTKITSVLICAGCRKPLRTGGDRLWALRCGHMIDSRCYIALSRPQFSTLPLIFRLDAPAPPKRLKTGKEKSKEKGKGKPGRGIMESHDWNCPVKDCGRVHTSERVAGEEDWAPSKENGAIKVFI